MSGLVWITGASQGLGRQAALEFAKRGWRVAATARNEENLKSLEAEAAGHLGDVTAFPGDVTDPKRMAEVISEIETQLGDITTAVLNAGTYYPMMGRDFSAETVRKQFEANVMGAAWPLEHLIPRMIARKRGRIYLVASVSGYCGLPRAGAYGMTKAGLINLAESLRTELKPLGVTVGVVNPGFIDTPLTQKNEFPMPMLMPVDKAAREMVDGVLSGKFEVVFPRTFVWLMKLGRMLPYGLYFPLARYVTRGREA
ncbi:MAG: SDR family NAD(P)-dependent oxidoreductase [Minwuia sp.]|uniref:SDR family NAD(P)-dependent oxidoreductase n=1 Tax=Minwuia sp. TaxID=2493630 RepID=UPI003A896774